ncbi:PAS domain S-box protein [Desulfosoma caldarium]|uniref:histidine kinase n=1 Tax=Desulfosoma caldarium TaxID=610254 RepID=A0A3N1VU92_9BACT|nr:PAS domain S-box protein [Desulfosoma caldarium]ROR03347.1 PAS domain S-box-containing protein [Desulfosoma caldarium]
MSFSPKKSTSPQSEIDALHAALQESEARYRLVMEATSDGIWDWDLRTNRVYYNPAYARMLGFEPEEFSGNLAEWLDRIHPDDRQRAISENQRCIHNEVAQFAVEFRMRTKAGNWKWILGRGMAVERDSAGKALRMIGAHTDITRIKEGEHRETVQGWIAALLASMTQLDERLELVLDTVLEAVAMDCGGIYLLDPEKNTLRLVCQQGLSESFVQAVRWYGTDSPNMQLVLAGTPVYTTYEDLSVRQSGKGTREGLQAIAVVPIHYEGRVVGCLNAASRTLRDVPQETRTFLETVAVNLGNTLGRLQVRQELLESTRQYEALFELAGDALFVVRLRDRRILDANRAASTLLGYGRGELLGFVWDTLIDASEGQDFVDRCRAQLASRDQCLVEGYVRTRMGTAVPVEISAKPFAMKGEQVLFMMARNISERIKAQEEKEQLQEQLRHAQKMESIGRLAASIAHDFNNVLAPILGHGDILSRYVDANSPLRRHVNAIGQAAFKAKDLVQKLLDFSRDQPAAFENTNLVEKLQAFHETLASTLPPQINVRLSLPSAPVWVKADPVQMDRVLMNLVANARDAMPEGGTLSILLEQKTFYHQSDMPCAGLKPGTYAVLTVADTGMGMDQETLKKIFEPFFTSKSFGRGTGLGLSIVYGIVENHRGHILASSIPGIGTAFEIYLPVTSPPGS